MQSIVLTSVLRNQTHLTEVENQRWARYHASISLAAGSGLFFVLLGVFLLIVFTASGGGNSSLNRAGVGSLVAGFVFFGFTAHFMDECDSSEREYKRSKLKI